MLVLSQYVELGLAMKLLADSAEGAGYLLKDRISDVGGVRRCGAARRRRRLGDRPDHRLDAALQAPQRRSRSTTLTPREREVLVLMAEGRSNQGIADKLVITLRAVEKYVSSIFGKLGLPSRGQRVAARSRRAAVPALLSALGGGGAAVVGEDDLLEADVAGDSRRGRPRS